MVDGRQIAVRGDLADSTDILVGSRRLQSRRDEPLSRGSAMSKVLVVIAAILALVAIALSAYVWTQSQRPMKETEEAIAQLRTRADASERQVGQLRQQIAAL